MKIYKTGIALAVTAIAMLAFGSPAMAGDYASDSGSKFTRGLANAATGWGEIPKNIALESEENNVLVGITYGTVTVAITRCGNFYGGGDLNWNRIVPGTIRSIVRGQRPVIRSDGQYVRDYFYVEDGAEAYIWLAEQLAQNPELYGQAFNFSNETPITVLELVERILKAMDSTLTPEIRNEASNEIRCQHLSSAKARRLLDWHPLFTIEEGLQRTIEWYKSFLGVSS